MRSQRLIAIFALGLWCWACSAPQRQTSMQATLSEPAAKPATRPTTRRVENHDEGRAWYKVLPNPLILQNGQPIRDAQTWYSHRRPEILRMFESQIYGRA